MLGRCKDALEANTCSKPGTSVPPESAVETKWGDIAPHADYTRKL